MGRISVSYVKIWGFYLCIAIPYISIFLFKAASSMPNGSETTSAVRGSEHASEGSDHVICYFLHRICLDMLTFLAKDKQCELRLILTDIYNVSCHAGTA